VKERKRKNARRRRERELDATNFSVFMNDRLVGTNETLLASWGAPETRDIIEDVEAAQIRERNRYCTVQCQVLMSPRDYVEMMIQLSDWTYRRKLHARELIRYADRRRQLGKPAMPADFDTVSIVTDESNWARLQPHE